MKILLSTYFNYDLQKSNGQLNIVIKVTMTMKSYISNVKLISNNFANKLYIYICMVLCLKQKNIKSLLMHDVNVLRKKARTSLC